MASRAGGRSAATLGAVLPVVVVPALLVAGGLWFAVALSTVRAGDLGVGRLVQPRVEGDAFPRAIVDPSGARTAIVRPPERIVSLTLGGDEILTALVDPGRIVGVSRFADSAEMSMCVDRVPAHAARIRALDPERILALEPDMVFAATYNLDSGIRILVGAGVPVLRFSEHRSFLDVAENVRVAGAALGVEADAAELVRAMNERLASIETRVAGRVRPRVLYYSPVGYTSGAETLVDEKIRRAGGRNTVAEIGIVGPKHLSVDMLVALDPDVIIVPRWSPSAHLARDLVADPIWANVPAVMTGRVYDLDSKWLTSVSPDGVRGVEEIARALHPEAFSS